MLFCLFLQLLADLNELTLVLADGDEVEVDLGVVLGEHRDGAGDAHARVLDVVLRVVSPDQLLRLSQAEVDDLVDALEKCK